MTSASVGGGGTEDPALSSNPYQKHYHYDEEEDNYDPHCFFSSGLAQNRKRLGFIATCSTVQCKDAGSAGYDPLLPFKEDLAEWLYKMIGAEILPEKFFQELQSGVYLCKLGIHMQRKSVKYRREHPEDTFLVPPKPPTLKYANATRKSPPFYCRDNISNFLDWSIEFGVKHSCRFETDDLTLRKNDRQIVIHLMEVGRLGVKFGIEPPTLIKLEMALEEPMPAPAKGASTLDEKVQALAAECTCSVPFKVNRISEGRYKVGEGRSMVFVRVLRSHVMVRVGGGWETLAAYFSKMDPCRATIDSFGGKGAGSPTGKLKQRVESNEELDQPVSPKRTVSVESTPEPELEIEEDSAPPPPIAQETVVPVQSNAPPPKPKRPVIYPSPAAVAATSDPLKTKRAAPATRTKSPAKSPQRSAASIPATPRAVPANSRTANAPPRESVTSPTPRPVNKPPSIIPKQTKASLLRTSSPSAIKTPAPANGPTPTKSSTPSSRPDSLTHPPWRFVPNNTRAGNAPPKPASRVSGEAGPSTPNFQRPSHASTLDRKVPPTQNKRLVPVGGKALPKSDKYNRATQSVAGKPKITSPELIRRAMEIMKDNGEVEKESEVVRKPSNPALKAAIEEIAEDEYLCEADEMVDVEVPEEGPEPSVTDLAPDSGVDTLAESKPIKVTENATVGDSSVPFLSGADTLQDISDMITDDQDRSEMEHLEELPDDEPGFQVQDLPAQDIVIEPIEVYCEDLLVQAAEPPVVEEESQREVSADLATSEYDGGTTEDELNEAVSGRLDSCSSSGQATGTDVPMEESRQSVDDPDVIVGVSDTDVFVGVTIAYPSEHQVTSVITELPEEPTEIQEPVEVPEIEKVQEIEEIPSEEGEDGVEGEDGEKHIYVANIGSDYDIAEQIESINEVELAISEGEDDEPAPVITESMIKRMEEYMRAKSELEDTIDEFENTLETDEDEEYEEEVEVQEVEKEPQEVEEELQEVEEELQEVEKELQEVKDELQEVEEPQEIEQSQEVAEEATDVTDVGTDEVGEVSNDVPESVSKRMEEFKTAKIELEECIDEFKRTSSSSDEAQEPVKEEENVEIREDANEVEEVQEDGQPVEDSDQDVEKEDSKSNVQIAVEDLPIPDEAAIEELLPEPILVDEETAIAESDTAGLPDVAPMLVDEETAIAESDTTDPPDSVPEQVGPESDSFSKKVQRLEDIIQRQRGLRPSNKPEKEEAKIDNIVSNETEKEEIEVDNIVMIDMGTVDIPMLSVNEIKPVEAVVPETPREDIPSAEKERIPGDLIDNIPPPIENEEVGIATEEQLEVADLKEPVKELSASFEEAVELSESVEVPSQETKEEVIETKPDVKEAEVEVDEVLKEPVTEVVVKEVVEAIPIFEKTEVETVDLPEEPAEEEGVIDTVPDVAVPVEKEEDIEIEDLEVIKEDEAEEGEGGPEQPLSESEEVVMKPDKTPLPNNSTLNMAPRRYSFEQEVEPVKSDALVEELKRNGRSNKRSLNSSGQTSDSDRSTASDKDTSSGYHEDYESEGDELGSNYNKVPDVIMEQDKQTRSILKGSVKDSMDSGKQSLASTPSLPKQRMKSDQDDEVFEEERVKGLNLPSEGHVREAVFTKAIESAINPLAYGIQIPGMDELQSASIVLPSKKAIRKASDGEYGYQDRRQNLEKVIAKPHTEKSDMLWDEQDETRNQAKIDGQTRDEKVHKWSGTLRSSQKKKKTFRTKKFTEDDILKAITQQADVIRSNCPVHAAKAAAATTQAGAAPKKRVPISKRPTTTPASRVTPGTRPATRPSTATSRAPAKPAVKSTVKPAAKSKPTVTPKTTPSKSRAAPKRKSSVPLYRPAEPVVPGSKAVAVKPASHVSNPQEVMSPAASSGSGPLNPSKSKTKPVINVTKSTPVRRTPSLKEGQRAPLRLSNSLSRDKIRPGPKFQDLP